MLTLGWIRMKDEHYNHHLLLAIFIGLERGTLYQRLLDTAATWVYHVTFGRMCDKHGSVTWSYVDKKFVTKVSLSYVMKLTTGVTFRLVSLHIQRKTTQKNPALQYYRDRNSLSSFIWAILHNNSKMAYQNEGQIDNRRLFTARITFCDVNPCQSWLIWALSDLYEYSIVHSCESTRKLEVNGKDNLYRMSSFRWIWLERPDSIWSRNK